MIWSTYLLVCTERDNYSMTTVKAVLFLQHQTVSEYTTYRSGSEGSLGVVTKISVLTPAKLPSTNVAFLSCNDYKSCQVHLPWHSLLFFLQKLIYSIISMHEVFNSDYCLLIVFPEITAGSKEELGWDLVCIWIHGSSLYWSGTYIWNSFLIELHHRVN